VVTIRDCVHAAGRVLTRGLLHPRLRDYKLMARVYLRLYLLGKRLTERRELAMLRGLIAPGMVIVDVGANAGFYTLKMAAMVGPTGRILAFEPDAFNFDLLQERARRAGAANVEMYQMAIGEKTGRAILYRSAYNRADNRLHASHREAHVEAGEVQVCSLDEFMLSHNSQAIDGIKLDVQGAEEHVLRGARAVLQRGVRWIMVEFSPEHLRGAGTDPRRFVALLEDLGLDIFELDDAGSLQPFSGFESYMNKIGSGYGDLVLRAGVGAGPEARPPRDARA
jgi:FkbM family methyltransferase